MTGVAHLLPPLIAALAGVAVGVLHFRSLRLVAALIVEGRLGAVGLQLARLLGVGLFLGLCAWIGAASLLAASAGLLLGRALALREGG